MVTRVLAVLTIAFGLSACGGSGSDSNPLSTNPVGGATLDSEGTVSLLIGDGPIDDFDQAVFELTQIRLLGADDRSEPLLNSPATVDLLELENISELLVDGTSVPAGTYEKIRLEISSITLHRTDDNGDIVPGESISVAVPASGKIDLNPRGSFTIAEGGSLELEVDIDLEGSIRTNRDGSIRFRPVVFIDQIDEDYRGRNSRMFGVMRNLDVGVGTLELCNARRLSDDSEGSDDDMPRCIDVRTGERTLFVNALADSIEFESLIDGEEATVFGRYRNRGVLAAIIAVGERNTFRNLEGDVATTIAADGTFTVTVDDLKGVEEDQTIRVRLAENAKVFGDDSDEALDDLTGLRVGSEIEARGVLIDGAEGAMTFVAFFLHIESDDGDETTDTTEEEIELLATIESIDLDNRRITVLDGEQNVICVELEEDTELVSVSDSSDAAETTEIALSELEIGDNLDISGEQELGEECVDAEYIVVSRAAGD